MATVPATTSSYDKAVEAAGIAPLQAAPADAAIGSSNSQRTPSDCDRPTPHNFNGTRHRCLAGRERDPARSTRPGDLGSPVLGPRAKCVEVVEEFLAEWGQCEPGSVVADEARGSELFQALIQDRGGDAIAAGLEFPKRAVALVELPDHTHCPCPSQEIEQRHHRAAGHGTANWLAGKGDWLRHRHSGMQSL
jgi:hypothetical protein